MKKVNHEITRYEHKGFYIDIVNTGECLEAWITKKDYGVSELMFGVEAFGGENEAEEFADGLVDSGCFDEHVDWYKEEYC